MHWDRLLFRLDESITEAFDDITVPAMMPLDLTTYLHPRCVSVFQDGPAPGVTQLSLVRQMGFQSMQEQPPASLVCFGFFPFRISTRRGTALLPKDASRPVTHQTAGSGRQARCQPPHIALSPLPQTCNPVPQENCKVDFWQLCVVQRRRNLGGSGIVQGFKEELSWLNPH